jgi:hypothetical protein
MKKNSKPKPVVFPLFKKPAFHEISLVQISDHRFNLPPPWCVEIEDEWTTGGCNTCWGHLDGYDLLLIDDGQCVDCFNAGISIEWCVLIEGEW